MNTDLNLNCMKFFLLCALLSGSFILKSQPIKQQIRLKGTLSIIAITKDGIILASDSRGSIFDKEQDTIPVAYIDSIPKIFRLGKFIIAPNGTTVLGCQLIYNIIKDFSIKNMIESDIETQFRKFEKYFKKRFPADSFPEQKVQQFIGGGFYNNIPYLVGFNYNNFTVVNSLFMVSDINAMKYLYKYRKPRFYTANEYSIILEKVIREFARDNHKEYNIGGPISIIKITPQNKISFIQNDFSKLVYPSICDFLKYIKNNSYRLIPCIRNGRKIALDFLLRSPCCTQM